jgi:hypothetical protein
VADPGTQNNEDSPRSGVNGFVRDVGINVIANLIAAAIIYLGGALWGVFPRSQGAISASMALLSICGLLTVAVSLLSRDNFKLRSVAAFVGAILLSLIFFGIAFYPADLNLWLRIFMAGMASFLLYDSIRGLIDAIRSD